MLVKMEFIWSGGAKKYFDFFKHTAEKLKKEDLAK